jgi:hypothetical protein
MVQPISPDEVSSQKSKDLPDIVIETWNSVIARKFFDGSAKIVMKDIKAELVAMTGKGFNEVRALGYLDIEEVYRSAGWEVGYHKPGYTETSFYIFKKK